MVYFAQDREDPVLVVIRGDLDVNERNTANLLNAAEVRRALPDELKSYGLIQGFLSPMGDHGSYVVADDSVLTSRTYVAGANKPDYHMTGVVPGRDFKIDVTADIAAARANDPCAVCGAPLTVKKA